VRQIDRYQIEAELDSGGFGTVFRARHVVLGRKVALKLLHPSRESSLDIVERFLREARILSSIASPHVVQVIDAGMTGDRQLFLAMELLDGISLAARLEHQSPLTVHHALSITRQVAKGLAAAHAAGVVHRDLKPGNIFLTRTADGREFAKVLDFGISKSHAREADNVITMTGAVLGTPHYMAPEQLHGARDVDARADLYSLAVCLYEMLSGHLPYAANTLEALLAQRLRDPPTPITTYIPHLPFELVTIIDRGLARDPDARFLNIAEFDAALGRLDPLHLPATTPPHVHAMPVATAQDPQGQLTANARGRSNRPLPHPSEVPAAASAATVPAVSFTPWPANTPPPDPSASQSVRPYPTAAPSARPYPTAPPSARPSSSSASPSVHPPPSFPPVARPTPSISPPPHIAHSTPPAPMPVSAAEPARSAGNITLFLLLGGAVIVILVLIAALVSITALFITRNPSSRNRAEPATSPASPPSPYAPPPSIGPMVPVRETSEPAPAPTTSPAPIPRSPETNEGGASPRGGTGSGVVTGPGVVIGPNVVVGGADRTGRTVHAFVTRTIGDVDTSTFDALFGRATRRLNECRRSVDDDVRLQVFVGPERRLSIVQPDVTQPHGHEETARCAASAIHDAGPLERESGHGIVQVTIQLRAR
jgi:serine/threonine-protein kinase